MPLFVLNVVATCRALRALRALPTVTRTTPAGRASVAAVMWPVAAAMAPVAVVLALTGCAVSPSEQRDGLQIDALDAELSRLERQGMVGQVVVARGGELVYGRGVGTRTPDGDEPVTLETVFPLASVTKPFAAAAVIALAADGHIALDDPIGRHLSDLEPPWADLPVRTLLTHTSGVAAEIVNREWEGEPRFEPVGRHQFLNRVQQFTPRGTPGQRFRYSNVGYGVLGALIEAVSGESWEHYLGQRLLAPAGLEGIGVLLPGWDEDELVVGRERGRRWGTYLERPMLEDGIGFNLRASGDLHATARALFEWWRLLRADAWLPAEWSRQWFERRVREPDGAWYGYGWHFRETSLGLVIGHTGGDGIHATDFSWYREADVMIYIATADPRWEADVIRDRLHARVLATVRL